MPLFRSCHIQTFKARTPPPVEFYKPGFANWTLPEFQDQLTDSLWLTRQDKRPVYNYKYYLDTFGRDAINQELVNGTAGRVLDWHGRPPSIQHMTPPPHTHTHTRSINSSPVQFEDFYYFNADSAGLAHWVLWGLLSDTGFTDPEKACCINSTYVVSLGSPNAFQSFANLITMICIAKVQWGMPIEVAGRGASWLVDRGALGFSTLSGTDWEFALGKDLAIYIPEENMYCTFEFTHWGEGSGGGGAVGWKRQCFSEDWDWSCFL